MVPGTGYLGHHEYALSGGTSWLLKEFELIDLLISQLELMSSSDRRRALMSLQYSLAAADVKQVM
jgi:hypothetical protein